MRRLVPPLHAVIRAMALASVCISPAYGVVITAGRICDGSEGPPYGADIGIKGGRLAAIGHLPPDAAQVIQA